MQKGRLSSHIWSAKGLVTVDRSQAGEQYAQEFGASRSTIANQQQPANIFIDNSFLKSLSIKEKSIFWSVYPMQIKMESWSSLEPYWTYYELDYGHQS